MAIRARLAPPKPKQEEWNWHEVNSSSMSVKLLLKGDRRMEGEAYLRGGYGLRLALMEQPTGWKPLGQLANVWQPNRLKGIIVSPEHGTPFLAATQVYDQRPIPRKWLSLKKIRNKKALFVNSGQILVTRSGNVGKATLARTALEDTLISDDLLRVEPNSESIWGWLYAYLRSPQARSIMQSAQYGQIIKHLEVSHLDALPCPVVNPELQRHFNKMVQKILDLRNEAYKKLIEAENLYEEIVGSLPNFNNGESGFSVKASQFFGARRRFDALPHNPEVEQIIQHLTENGKGFTRLADAEAEVWLPNRFKRIPANEGVELIGSSALFEINPDEGRLIADIDYKDPNNGRVKEGWLLISRSGQIYGLIGSVAFATSFHEGKIVTDDIIRLALPHEADLNPGYLYIALTHPTLGRPLMKSLSYGSSIPHIEPEDIKSLQIVRLNRDDEQHIGKLAHQSSHMFSEADSIEKEVAQEAGAILERFSSGDLRDVILNG